MNNMRRRAMAQYRRAMAEYEDWLESRKPPSKLMAIKDILDKYECHKESEDDDCGVMYTVLFKDNSESYPAIRQLRALGVECHNESDDWEDYDGQDTMWTVCWTRETIYGKE